ncbi:MAG: hypothetical protein J6M62_01765 [Selenomonadaceae bacterium]|nr:hypothetical protein [Selenomonadaceae bacterium]
MGRWLNIPIAGAVGGCIGASVPVGEMAAGVPAENTESGYFVTKRQPIGGASVSQLVNGTEAQPEKQPPAKSNISQSGYFKTVRKEL